LDLAGCCAGRATLSLVVEFPASLWKLNISLRINQNLSVEKEIPGNCKFVSHEQQQLPNKETRSERRL
jgi:hypothetical protein